MSVISIGISDNLSLVDIPTGSSGPDNSFLIIDTLNFNDTILTSFPQTPSVSESYTLSDAIGVLISLPLSVSDTLAIADFFDPSAFPHYSDSLFFSDLLNVLIGNVAPTAYNFLISDLLAIADQFTVTAPKDFIGVSETVRLSDYQRVLLSSTLDGYLRRYLNDVLPRS